MNNVLKNGFYTVVGSSLLVLNNIAMAVDANSLFGKEKVIVGGENRDLDVAAQGYIDKFALYLSLIAVAMALWGGFNILTAAGDEEKVKTGKTVIIHAVIGLLVIFLAKSIINWFLGILS